MWSPNMLSPNSYRRQSCSGEAYLPPQLPFFGSCDTAICSASSTLLLRQICSNFCSWVP